jgi:hypothetical protein
MMEALSSSETSALKEPHGITSQMTESACFRKQANAIAVVRRYGLFGKRVRKYFKTGQYFSNPNQFMIVGFAFLTAVVIKIATVWDIEPCTSYVNQRFGA